MENVKKIIEKLNELIGNANINLVLLNDIHKKLYRVNKVGERPNNNDPVEVCESIKAQLSELNKPDVEILPPVEKKIVQINKRVSNTIKRAELANLTPEEKTRRKKKIAEEWLKNNPTYFKKWREGNPEYTAEWLKNNPNYHREWLNKGENNNDYKTLRKVYDKDYNTKKKLGITKAPRIFRADTILDAITNGSNTQRAISGKLGINLPAVNVYIKKLISKGKITANSNGAVIIYSLV